jgi:hypothetical protein
MRRLPLPNTADPEKPVLESSTKTSPSTTKLLAATVTPERSHLLQPRRFLGATLFYCYRLHVLILVGNFLDS